MNNREAIVIIAWARYALFRHLYRGWHRLLHRNWHKRCLICIADARNAL